MAAILPAVITGGASVLGAGVSSVGNKSAAKTQAATADKALGFAKEQEATRQKYYDQAMQQYQAQWLAQQARKDALLKYYGFDVSSLPTGAMSAAAAMPPGAAGPTGPMAAGPRPVGAASGYAVPRVAASAAPEASSLADLMQPRAVAQATQAPDLGSWSDWSRYGLAPERG